MSEWISVKDRLPNTGQFVIVYRPSYSQKIEIINWWDGDENYLKATHWQPLPEPPNEL